MSPSVPLSSYVQLHTTGTSEGVLIRIVEPVGYSFSIGEEVLVNKPIPFVFSIVRFLACAVLIGAVLCLRPSSPVYKLGFTWRKSGCRALAVALCVVEIAALLALSYRGFETNDTREAHDQYDDLANAFIAGSVSLDKDVPDFLGDLDNPYDPGERNAYLASVGDPALSDSFTDFAYFGDRFYLYFGPVPALELFVSCKLLTGADMPTWLAVFFYGSAFFVLVKVLLLQFSRKMMDARISIGAFLLLDLMLCCSSGFLYLGYLPVVYSAPIAASLAHLVAALSCWLLAKKGEGALSRPLLAVGALLMVLTLGCRQSFVICALLAIPLFWDEIVQHRAFFSKKGALNTALVIVPFLLVGAAAMLYNEARFGSPFDFGASYNLTSNDMTQRGFEWARFPLGVFAYLFQSLSVSSAFPYLFTNDVMGDYQGFTSSEPMFGGFYAFNVVALAAFALFSMRFEVPRQARAFGVVALGLGVVLMLFDIQASGITARYLSDFSFLLMLPASIAMLALFKRLQGSGREKLFVAVCFAGVLACVVLNCWALFIDGRFSPLKDSVPLLYYGVKQTLSFLW